jgi:DNA-binding PadR family transcriptional regulator
MSATRLLILGALRFLQPAHGYLIRQELESWSAESWANIAYGSIYHALGKMADEGLVEAVEPGEREKKSARIRYAITSRGEEEFQRLLRRYWWGMDTGTFPFLTAFSFIDALSRDEVIAGLRQRVSTFEGQIRAREFLERSPEWLQDYKPPHVFEMMKLMKAHIDVEIAFARDLADRLEAGDTLGGEFPIAPDPTQAPEPKTN